MPADNLDGNACHAHACALQSCMQKELGQKTPDQANCQHLVAELYRCCARFYVAKGPAAEVDACPLLPVVRRKLKAAGEAHLLNGVPQQ